ncbi:hypothetical protein SDJN03_08941, partial [Cucurbita argyrosperma subsp. sororia]
MASSNDERRKPKSPSCCFSISTLFKSRARRKRWDDDAIAMEDTRKVWPSDDDKGRHWVAEPGIDRKAKAYIDRIHYQIRYSVAE